MSQISKLTSKYLFIAGAILLLALILLQQSNHVFGQHLLLNDTGITTRLSVASDGSEGAGHSSISYPFGVDISADGSVIAFAVDDSQLVPLDLNNSLDIFVHNTQTAEVNRVSVNSSGSQGNGNSYSPSVSSNGQLVAFVSESSNLVDADSNNADDIFLHDIESGATTRVSIATDGSQANGASTAPQLSADGEWVAFVSQASNLVANDTNNVGDVFLHNIESGTTTRVSVDSDGDQFPGQSLDPSINADGQKIAFQTAPDPESDNSLLGDSLHIHNTETGETDVISSAEGGESQQDTILFAKISSDGNFITFSSSAPSLTGDSSANIVSQIFLVDLTTDELTLISKKPNGALGNSSSQEVDISADGSKIVFKSGATNLDPSDTSGNNKVIYYDGATAEFKSIAVSSSGEIGDFGGENAVISDDGLKVAFWSFSSNLVEGDTNELFDVFLHDLGRILNNSIYLPAVMRDYTRAEVSCLNTEVEPNGTNTEAEMHDQICIDGTTLSGSIENSSDTDIFYFELITSSALSIELTNIPTGDNYEMILLDSSGNDLGNSINPGNQDESITTDELERGTYYVRIVAGSGSTFEEDQSYRLTVTKTE